MKKISNVVSKNSIAQTKLNEETYEILKPLGIANIMSFEKFTQMSSKNILRIREYLISNDICKNCIDPSHCRQQVRGLKPIIEKDSDNNILNVIYTNCEKYEKRKGTIDTEKFADSFKEYIDFGDSLNRKELIKYLAHFVVELRHGRYLKGAYVYGEIGAGKTHILHSFYKQISSICGAKWEYLPDFSRRAKANMYQFEKLENLLSEYKHVSVLFLDGLGDEQNDSWFRDEVFSSVLNYRIKNNKPTFYLTNFDFDSLKKHLEQTVRGTVSKVKSERIVNWIKQSTEVFMLKNPKN